MSPLIVSTLQRRRRFFLLLPLLTLPFLTLVFWALNSSFGNSEKDLTKKHLNTELPEADVPHQTLDKLSLYEQSVKDSSEEKATFGHRILSSLGLAPEQPPFDSLYRPGPANEFTMEETSLPLQEKRLLSQIERLEKEISRQPQYSRPSHSRYNRASEVIPDNKQPQVSLEHSVLNTEQSSHGEDPEVRQLDEMLEKILDIQHPERVKQRLELQARVSSPSKAQVYPARDSAAPASGNTIAAVIHSDQTVTNGTLVKLRLSEDILVHGFMLPKNSFLFGTCQIEKERLKIKVSTILHGENIFPVSLTAYDLDGQEGLHAPGSLTHEAIQTGSENATQHLQVLSLNPSLSAQAAETGLQTLKNLFRRKVRLIKVKVKAGHRLLLRNSSPG